MKRKNVRLVCLISSVWLLLSITCLLKKPSELSDTERRKLAQFPSLTTESVLEGAFAQGFEDYVTDQFPMRNRFRTLKAYWQYYGFRQKDNNGIYIHNGYAGKLEYPINETSIVNACDKFNALYELYMKNKNCNIFASVVPDKGFFMAKDGGYPSLDYQLLFNMVKSGLPFAKYISIEDSLELSDYYKTDTHWRQEEIVEATKKLAHAMGIKEKIHWNFSKIETNKPFYGVYYGQSALPLQSDSLSYLTSPVIEAAEVYHEDTKETTAVYDRKKLDSKDPYEIYLFGAVPLLTIENPLAETRRELVVFRDSFGSSITPLLIEAYSKITLVDIRYINSNLIGEYVEFDDTDVLFLYSTLVLNNSAVLK